MAEFSFERATIAGVNNKNGYYYSAEDFDRVYNMWKEMYEPLGLNYIYAHYDRGDIHEVVASKPEYIMGKVISVTDTHVNVQVFDHVLDALNMYKDPVVSFGFIGTVRKDGTINMESLAYIEFNEKELCYSR